MNKISGRTVTMTAGALVLTALLGACGGGGGGESTPPAASCSLADTRSWLLGYMQEQYLWYARMPSVDAAAQPTVETYFAALLYPGGGVDPASRDRWSYVETTANHDQFFGEGRSLGYGLAVGGIELRGRPDEPLRVRYVEPKSPAAAAGLQRGDILLSLNGVSSADVITRDDFSALTPKAAGDVLQLQVRSAGGDRAISVTAAVFDLSPVGASQVLRTAAGRLTGYLLLKDFISQASTPLDAAFAQFKAAGVTELVLDLRYNGGGLVSVARDLASYIGGQAARGGVFAALKYSDKRQGQNSSFNFELPNAGLALTRVFVLSGQRTCSASELVINGLKPFVEVVQIGGTSCGKPVGFVPKAQCGNTYNAVNFESVNAAGAGRYWDGLAPRCSVADTFTRALGDPTEALTAAALAYADGGSCPAVAPAAKSLAARPRGAVTTEPGERQGMWLR